MDGEAQGENDMANLSKRAKIYLPYHDNFDVFRSPSFDCVYIGEDRPYYAKGLHFIQDVDNALHRNPPLNEMVAYYHAWKHADADYVGVMHYRRHMILDPNVQDQFREDEWGVVNFPNIYANYEEKIGLGEENLSQVMRDYDVVLPKPWSVRQAGSENLYEHFRAKSPVGIDHLDLALDLIERDDLELGGFARGFVKQDLGMFTNTIFAERTIFNDYCSWYFKLSNELEAAIGKEKLSPSQFRMYVSEWMFMIYFSYWKEKKNWRILHAKRTFIENPKSAIEPLRDAKGIRSAVPIATVSSDDYSQHTAALIVSIAERLRKDRFADIVIVGDGWTEGVKTLYARLTEKYENVSIRFFEMDGYDDLNVHSHFTKHTFFRFEFPSIFKNYDKIIYLDGDTIVNDDIAELYDFDMEGNALAAVPCIAMKMMVAEKIGCLAECGQFEAGNYLKNYLGLNKEDADNYFNAGVLCIDIPKMSIDWQENLTANIESRRGVFWFVDQDILNMCFAGRVKPLPERWNLQNIPLKRLSAALPIVLTEAHCEARDKPAIIHYAGGERKPWSDLSTDLAPYYWNAVASSPWHEQSLASVTLDLLKRKGYDPNEIAILRRELADARLHLEHLRWTIAATIINKNSWRERIKGLLGLTKVTELINDSGYFDPRWYRARYGIQVTEGREIEHFNQVGWRMGLSPSLLFDVPYYLEMNPDVRYSGSNPLLHYLKYGKAEGRRSKSLDI